MFILNEYNEIKRRDIVFTKRTIINKESRFHRINYNNVAYFSLHYVLFFSKDKLS